jgi:hypothetical protein
MIFNHQLPIIMIVGAGNIGKWHIQSISTLKFLCKIFIIDSNEKNLLYSKNFFNKNSINIKNVFFLKNIPKVDKKIDVLIIATKSDNRALVLEKVLKNNFVKSIILEKIVACRHSDIYKIKKLINFYKIKNVYVNCPRRLFPSYIKLKKIINNNNITMEVSGVNWNSTSNLIHFLDLFCFLTGLKNLKLVSLLFHNKKQIKNKFIYYSGEYIFSRNNFFLKITDKLVKNKNVDVKVLIKGKKINYTILETKKLYINNITNRHFKFNFINQSILTSKIVRSLLNNKKVGLIKFLDSINHHKIIIEILETYLKKNRINKKYFIT